MRFAFRFLEGPEILLPSLGIIDVKQPVFSGPHQLELYATAKALPNTSSCPVCVKNAQTVNDYWDFTNDAFCHTL